MKFSTLVIVLVVALAVIGGVRYLGGMGLCSWYGYQTDREVRYSGFVGCMVKTNNGWTPRTELRTVAE